MTIFTEIDRNKVSSLTVIVGFSLVVLALGGLFGHFSGYGYSVFVLALIFSVLSSWGSFYYSDKIILKISGAKKAEESRYPDLFHLINGVCISAGLPDPEIYLIEDTAPNAFATGRDPHHAVICLTTGILSKLTRLELEGVVAHEVSHIKNYDIRFMSLVSVLVGVVTLLSDWFLRSFLYRGKNRDRNENASPLIFVLAMVLAVLSPLFATLIQLAISRRREFLADATGVLLTRYPEGLAKALEKITADREVLEAANRATAHLYIANPLKGNEFRGFLAGFFSTHPPVAERIRILRSI